MGRHRKSVDPQITNEAIVDEIVEPISEPKLVQENPKEFSQKERVMELIADLKGTGLELLFEDAGVTFKRGVLCEFINFSSSDRLIINAATRIARPR